jgi:rubrerythrin
MGVTFSADEVFEMAEQIERNGAKFYREAAANASDSKTKQMLLDMAAMEDGHLETFQQMRNELSEQEKAATAFDPYNEAALYLQAMADGRGTEGKLSDTQELTGKESTEQVLQAATKAERNSVLFYVGLKELVSARAGKDKVEAIIREEVAHIATLSKALRELK